ncbi:MAG TPA: glycosyltransferase family 4 protein [Bacteroidales bacterium]|jgi:glycosyltransferase involved in cell wall biosynthesis|nr:glycosyltransferase family 4 protein [Bacteroidales bacterium]
MKLIVGISAEGSVVLMEGQMRHFKSKGFDAYLMAPYSERVRQYCEREGCIHLFINVKRDISVFHDIVILIKIFRIFLRVKPDIINLGTPKVSLLGMIAGKLLGVPNRIYTCRGFRFEHEHGIKRKILILMERITAYCAHKIICISPSLRDFGIEHNLFKAESAIVINKGSSNGFNLKRFSSEMIDKNKRSLLIRELGIESKFVFGFVSRIYDRKGINELYHAFSRLSNQLPDIVLLIVGRFEEGQIADKSILEQLKKHSKIILVGSQMDVPLYLSLMDVFVLPAWGEGFGNVMVEAAAMGIPVIGTNATGIRDSFQNGFNGLQIEPKNPQELENAMILLYMNKELRMSLGKNGPIWAGNFDNMIIWKGMEQIYMN